MGRRLVIPVLARDLRREIAVGFPLLHIPGFLPLPVILENKIPAIRIHRLNIGLNMSFDLGSLN